MEKEFDGFIAVGCVMRGETTHYEIVSTESSRGLTYLGLEKICIWNAILTVENRLQAEDTNNTMIRYKNGAIGTVQLTTSVRPKDMQASIEVIGEKGFM